MKLAIAIALVLAFIIPAYAEEQDAESEMTVMAQCQAIEMSLMHQNNQLAASITALSPTPPKQLALIRDSYTAIVKDERTRLQEMVDLTKQVILPKFPDQGGQQFMAVLTKAIQDVQSALSTSDYDAQIKVQSKLLEASHACEAFVAHLNKVNDF